MANARARTRAACTVLAVVGLASVLAVVPAACSSNPDMATAPTYASATPTSDPTPTSTAPAPSASPLALPTPNPTSTPTDSRPKKAHSPTPTASITSTAAPVESQSAAIAEMPAGPYPREVPLEDLGSLCDYSDPGRLVASRVSVQHKNFREINGTFQLEGGYSQEDEFNFDTNDYLSVMRTMSGDLTIETRVVDGVKYLQYVVEGNVSAWFTDTDAEPPPLRKHSPQSPGVVCGYPLKWFTVAIDHGVALRTGIEVRQVTFFSNPSQVNPTSDDRGIGIKLEVWVGSAGQPVQMLYEEIRFANQPADGKIGRAKDESLWTYEYGPPIDIQAPQKFEEWTGEPFPEGD